MKPSPCSLFAGLAPEALKESHPRLAKCDPCEVAKLALSHCTTKNFSSCVIDFSTGI